MAKPDGKSSGGRNAAQTAVLGTAQSLAAWEELQTIAEIEQRQREVFPELSADLSIMDVKTAQVTMQEYEKFAVDYPVAVKQLVKIEPFTYTRHPPLMTTVEIDGKSEITLATQHFPKGHAAIDARLQELSREGRLIESSYREAFRHELFHVLHQHIYATHSKESDALNALLQKHYNDAGTFGENAKKIGRQERPHAEFFSSIGTVQSRGMQHPAVKKVFALLRQWKKDGKI